MKHLPVETFIKRRQQLMDSLPNKALLLVPSATLVTRSRDTEHPFRQDSDFWYLTGFNEPDALLVLMKGSTLGEQLLFNQPKDKIMETWTGVRLGQEAAVIQLGFDKAFTLAEIDAQLPRLLVELKMKPFIHAISLGVSKQEQGLENKLAYPIE